MKFKFRVTKYNPAVRNELGHYMVDDWTSISDIGKVFSGMKLTKEDYQKVEATYLSAIRAFLVEAEIDSLQISALENSTSYKEFKVGMALNIPGILRISKLALREKLWARLANPGQAYVHFGYDYYMYIGVPRKCPKAAQSARDQGLFVEPFRSPYLRAIACQP
jgi:hypothetical protein